VGVVHRSSTPYHALAFIVFSCLTLIPFYIVESLVPCQPRLPRLGCLLCALNRRCNGAVHLPQLLLGVTPDLSTHIPGSEEFLVIILPLFLSSLFLSSPAIACLEDGRQLTAYDSYFICDPFTIIHFCFFCLKMFIASFLSFLIRSSPPGPTNA